MISRKSDAFVPGPRETGQSAAYVSEWDSWREGGTKVVTSYDDFDAGLFAVRQAIAGGGGGGGNFDRVVGADPKKTTVLMAGLSGDEASALLQIFSTNKKVPKEQILVMPDFALKKKNT